MNVPNSAPADLALALVVEAWRRCNRSETNIPFWRSMQSAALRAYYEWVDDGTHVADELALRILDAVEDVLAGSIPIEDGSLARHERHDPPDLLVLVRAAISVVHPVHDPNTPARLSTVACRAIAPVVHEALAISLNAPETVRHMFNSAVSALNRVVASLPSEHAPRIDGPPRFERTIEPGE